MRIPFLTAVLLIATALALCAEDAVPLINAADPTAGWKFDNGGEFPGAIGELDADPAVSHEGQPSLRLSADLSRGGNYVQMLRDLSGHDIELDTLSFWLKAPDVTGLGMRLIDDSGQCHQLSLALTPPSDAWRRISFPVERFFAKIGTSEAVPGIAKYESWGGAKDGRWHGELRGFALLTSRSAIGPKSTIWIADLVATRKATAWSCDFEKADKLPDGWTIEGTAQITTERPTQGAHALLLKRAAEAREQPCSASGPRFPAAAGTWEVSCATASELESPDSSYCGLVQLEAFDAGGAVLTTAEIAAPFGKQPWQTTATRVRLPPGTATARIAIHLRKTVGELRIDALTAAPLQGKEQTAIDRAVLSTSTLGNLFLPGERRTFDLRIVAKRDLAAPERDLTWSVRDYWGAEQAAVANLTVKPDLQDQQPLTYAGSIDLSTLPLEIGRYYELHADIPLADGEPFHAWSSFAILPPAVTKAYRPDQIPFSSRNWDNRMPEYLRLADRLGVRIGGLWGGAEAEPPHHPYAPCIEVCAELGMAVLTGAPTGVYAIEQHQEGFERWTEPAIRGALRSWFATYGAHRPRPLVISLGNEPHNTGERLQESVRAYKIAYDEIKRIDPSAFVVATSVGASEDYFRLGYQDACDAFDFHVYETPEAVRSSLAEYRRLMTKYHCVKPVWSTEIGLNSQGQTRQHVAADMIRKHAAFFAGGGANISWFDFLYPDSDATLVGSSGEAHNIFDARYKAYAPKLDAITYYNLINGICIKRFADERTWPDGVHGCLFRDADGSCFTLLWKDAGRADIFLPLSGARDVQIIRIDGRRSTLAAGGKGIGLSVSEDPLLLAYAGPARLPTRLEAPPLRVTAAPASLKHGAAGTIEITTSGDPQRVSLIAPPGWTVARDQPTTRRFLLTAPTTSAVRTADLLLRLAGADGGIAAEISCLQPVDGSASEH